MSHPHLNHQLARLLLLLALLLPVSSQAQDVNSAHPLARGLLSWWLVQPPYAGGGAWWSLTARYHALLVNMGTGSGWQSSARADWSGEMRFDGVDDRVDLGDLPVWDFANMTFTVHLRFRSTSAANTMLITRRDVSSAGGWFLRHGNTGGLTARLYGTTSANLAAQWVSTRTGLNDGAWHSATIIYTTDMATVGGNLITGYVDGVLDAGTFTNPGPDGYNLCISDCALQFGGFLTGSAFLTGAMDDVRIWTRALTAAEVQVAHRDLPPTFGGLLVAPEVLVGQSTPVIKRRVIIE